MAPQVCIELIKKWEGFKSAPYLCPSKIPTIGYGFTTYQDGQYVTLADKPITVEEADLILALKVEKFYVSVKSVVPTELTENQLSALTSLAYNIGMNAFKDSTLLKIIKKDPANAKIRYEFTRWNKSRGLALAGLISRRKDEANLYFKP